MTGMVQAKFRSPARLPSGLLREAKLMPTARYASLRASWNLKTRRATSGSTPYTHLSFSTAALTGFGNAAFSHLSGEEKGGHHP